MKTKKKDFTPIYILILIILCLGISMYCKFFVPSNEVVVSGHSMEPTFVEGQELKINKNITPQIGDVVVIRHNFKLIIKRIAALPGDSIVIKDDGNIYVNDKYSPLNEYGICEEPGRLDIPVVLEDDEYFVLGDNRKRSASIDSRSISLGNVKITDIVGVVK